MSRGHQLEQADLQHGWVQVSIERDELGPFTTTKRQREVITLPSRRVTCVNSKSLLERVAAKTGSVVNALLAYSRGQLAIAPCVACAYRLRDHGNALPFPNCVFLPCKWGFACASCLARGNAAECSLNVARQEYINNDWESIDDISKIPDGSLQWLDRGHPLGRPGCIWALRLESDGRREHDLTRPAQNISRVYPPEIPGAEVIRREASPLPTRPRSLRINLRKKSKELAEKLSHRVEARKRRQRRRA